MIDPKSFYRKMDSLLIRIGEESDDYNFLPSILKALEAAFEGDLHISNGRLYQEEDDGFVLFEPSGPRGAALPARRIPIDSETVRQVFRHGSYIFDDPALGAELRDAGAASVPAAFSVVRGPARRWIFAYDLTEGWVREEIQLCMNAVRAALLYRLSSETIRSDMEQAAEIQRSLLPAAAPHVEGFAIAHRAQPAELVGGDLYDYQRFSDDIFGVSIGDASGHGLPAALLVRDVVTGLRMGLEEEMKIVHTIRKLNGVIHRSTFSTRFISLFYGEVERGGNLLYVNAGHPPPLLVHGRRVQELKSTGMILGPLPEISLQRAFAFMPPGAVLVLYSDGIFERHNAQKELFGIKRLTDLVIRHQQKHPRALVDLIFETVFAFGEEKPWEDDATVVVIKRADQQ